MKWFGICERHESYVFERGSVYTIDWWLVLRLISADVRWLWPRPYSKTVSTNFSPTVSSIAGTIPLRRSHRSRLRANASIGNACEFGLYAGNSIHSTALAKTDNTLNRRLSNCLGRRPGLRCPCFSSIPIYAIPKDSCHCVPLLQMPKHQQQMFIIQMIIASV